MIVLRWIGRLLAGLLLLLVLSVVYLWWSNRDLSPEYVEAKYGGEGLMQADILGVPVRYKVEGSGPPLVLLHSHFFSMRLWQPWVDILKDDFTVVRYDLTNHGLTGPDPTEDYSRERGMNLLLGLMDHLGYPRFHLGGSSTGGAIAWYTAARHPERIDKLILVNAPGMPRVTNKYMDQALPGWFGYVLYLLPKELFRAFLQSPIVDDSLVTDDMLTEFHELYRREGNRMGEFHRMRAYDKSDPRPDLARIIAPTLIQWGEANPQLPVEHVAQYEAALTQAASVTPIVYPGVGHVLPIEAPEASARDARNFLLGAL
ncbi:MAG: alpha/beta hydrolase [Pseudomonadota bacterium]